MYNTRLKSRNLVHCKTLQHKVKTFDIFWFLEVNTVSVYKNQFNTGCYSPVCGAGVCLASVFYRPWLIISYTETSDTTPGHKQGPNKSCHALHQTAPHTTSWRTRCNCPNVFLNYDLVHACPCGSIQGVRESARVPQFAMLCRQWAHLQCFAGRTLLWLVNSCLLLMFCCNCLTCVRPFRKNLRS